MKAAIYSRFSTDRQKKESTEDQAALLRVRCEREGWTVVGEYSDPGISGGTARRPGYQRLITDARRKVFDVVVSEDTSRLWRSMAEQAPRLAEWKDLGIALVTLSGIDSRQQGFALVAPMMGAFAELARTEASYRTRRGRKAAADRGHSTGGKVYGYESAPVSEGSSSARLVINVEQAAVVRRIFEMYAAGHSPKSIAKLLNDERIPSPGASWNRTGEKRRDGAWCGSAIGGQPEKGTGIINNCKYIGRVEFGRTLWTRSAQDSKIRRVEKLAKTEVTRIEPALRIVSDELWSRAQARRLAVRARTKTLNHAGGKGPRYAFSGLLTCAECGSRYVIISKSAYGCATNVNCGETSCSNSKRVKRAAIEERIMNALRHDLFTPERVADATRRYRRLDAERKANAGATEKAAAKRRAELEAKVADLTHAIASGALRGAPSIAAKVAGDIADVERELAALATEARPSSKVVDLIPEAAAKYRNLVAGLPALLTAKPDLARAMLTRLFGKIELRRKADGGLWARLETNPAVLIPLEFGGISTMDGIGGSGGRI